MRFPDSKNIPFSVICLLLCAVAFTMVSCKKNKPRRGLYWAEFYLADSVGVMQTRYDHSITVEQPSETSVYINGAMLQKNGNSISGNMGHTPAFSDVTGLSITAKWKNKGGNYTIEGDFLGAAQSKVYAGTFKMGSY